ncbi:MAG: hypothetical protein HY951_04770 [Bacteroidia bacterium]|nr:hypothetical protein [Bacteroidia bacterium]
MTFLKDYSPEAQAAIIAAFTAIITTLLSFLTKSWIEKRIHLNKLENEHKYEQQKILKTLLAKNKMQLLNIAEQLNHRLWNFSENYKENWLNVNGKYDQGNYFKSFVYRFVTFFAYIRKIEGELIFIDSTFASKKDLEFIKFLRTFPQIFCDVKFFEGFKYDKSIARDHFFRNNFEKMVESFIRQDKVISYNDYNEELYLYNDSIAQICIFFDGMTPEEERYRWDLIQTFHLTLIGFLNSYGFDFQYTSTDKINHIIITPRKSKLLANYKNIMTRYKLDSNKEFKKILETKHFA